MSVRVAVVGVAGIGRLHIQQFAQLDGAELCAVCDIVPPAAEAAAKEAGVPAYTDFAQLLATERPQAVSLCTPPASHLPLAAMAAERGVHVLAEKPMANTVANCQAMIDVCQEAGVVLMIGHKKRYLPAVRRLKELLAGDLGPVLHLNCRYPHPWMSNKDWYWSEDDGGGTQLENAVHTADLLRHLAGPVARVAAEGDSHFAEHRAPQINDACYTVRFAGGAIGCVNTGMVGLPALNFEDVYLACANGVAELSGRFDSPEVLRYAYRSAPQELHTESFPDSNAFAAEMAHFLECIASGQTPLTSGEEGREAVRLCLAVKQAVRSGEAVAL